ncbi:unnamed protein product [Trichogramma brassicae]|uniref:Uncharacterized protein n=1 Tax=Trichogramma brassicae TaxID=86971 RepID=A0A6H5I7D1_9HYME|nr:unnamed protein product [Trichogramma brassicae]
MASTGQAALMSGSIEGTPAPRQPPHEFVQCLQYSDLSETDFVSDLSEFWSRYPAPKSKPALAQPGLCKPVHKCINSRHRSPDVGIRPHPVVAREPSTPGRGLDCSREAELIQRPGAEDLGLVLRLFARLLVEATAGSRACDCV